MIHVGAWHSLRPSLGFSHNGKVSCLVYHHLSLCFSNVSSVLTGEISFLSSLCSLLFIGLSFGVIRLVTIATYMSSAIRDAHILRGFSWVVLFPTSNSVCSIYCRMWDLLFVAHRDVLIKTNATWESQNGKPLH